MITPLSDEYDLYGKPKAMLDSTTDGGCVIIRLGNDEGLGRELRAHIQTEKYVKQKNDGTLSDTTKGILNGYSRDNDRRRERLTALVGEMLPRPNISSQVRPSR